MERKLQKGNEETKEPEYCDTNFKCKFYITIFNYFLTIYALFSR